MDSTARAFTAFSGAVRRVRSAKRLSKLVTSAVVCVLFASAFVVAQAPASQPPADAVKAQIDKAGVKTVAKPMAKPGALVPAKIQVEKAGVATAVKIRGGGPINVRPVVAQANRAPLIQQFTAQATPAVRAELIFTRKVCQLKPEELRKIKVDADAALEQVVGNLVDAQFAPRARLKTRGTAQPQPADPNAALQEALTAVMRKNLTAEQFSRYQAELDKRAENRKKTAVRFLIEEIDRELYLSSAQRSRLSERLLSHWEGNWYVYLDHALYGHQYFPRTVEPHVTPILTAAQKNVWKNAQLVDIGMTLGDTWGGFMNDNDALVEELGEWRGSAPDSSDTPRIMMKAVIVKRPANGAAAAKPDSKQKSPAGAQKKKTAAKAAGLAVPPVPLAPIVTPVAPVPY